MLSSCLFIFPTKTLPYGKRILLSYDAYHYCEKGSNIRRKRQTPNSLIFHTKNLSNLVKSRFERLPNQCGRWDLNPHDCNSHKILSLARLPVPTLPRIQFIAHFTRLDNHSKPTFQCQPYFQKKYSNFYRILVDILLIIQ